QIAAGRGAGKSSEVQIGLPAFLGVLLPESYSAVSGNRSDCTTASLSVAPADVAPVRSGALVDGVLCGTVADQAGLSTGDVITSFGGHDVTSPGSLTALLRRYHPGSMVPVAWTGPDGRPHTALVTLTPGPAG
ncbi:MAG TPA: PDZ domain-containing protein, partial [Streptosporangiaceae bacterium]